MDTLRKAYGYVRVSGKGQVEGDGFRRQEAEIQAFAQANGYEVVHVYREEGVSGVGNDANRPAFQEMMTAILRNGVRVVIVEGLDRLAREYHSQELLITYLASKGVALLVARTRENVTEGFLADAMRRAMVQMQAVFSELEKNMLVKKLRQARDMRRADTGKCEGRHAYTHETLPEALREALEAIRAMRRTKPGQKRKSFAEIASVLNAQGLVTVQGKPFTGYNVQAIWRRHRKL
ncbi:recombinase family protein [Desulfovibrio aminophilus]|uniref:recombinase family protein n=1 Tax=Desulfovibrio aminophilus TaxID=81425 RepID=UPI003397A560